MVEISLDQSPGLQRLAQKPQNDDRQTLGHPSIPWLIGTACMVTIIILVIAINKWCRCITISIKTREAFRFISFVILHFVESFTHIAVMIVFSLPPGHGGQIALWPWLFVLVPAHGIIILVCIYNSFMSADVMQWAIRPYLKYPFILLFLGVLQLIQIKLAWDDYKRTMQQYKEGGTDVIEGKSKMPGTFHASMSAKFHCKCVDGLLESTVFAFVCTYILIVVGYRGNDHRVIAPWVPDLWVRHLLIGTVMVSCITVGLAMTELDNRTSASVHGLIRDSAINQLKHIVFRTSEVTLRILTIGGWLVFCLKDFWSLLGLFVLVLDYFFGVLLLYVHSGREQAVEARFILGVPMLVANVTQFVDMPGLALPSSRISRKLMWIRILEIIMFIVTGILSSDWIVQVILKHPGSLCFWALSVILWSVLQCCYASGLNTRIDVHSMVAYGDADSLEEFLEPASQDVSINLNRHGADGLAPLHIATINGQMKCLTLLLEARADLEVRTLDGNNSTVLHLAAMQKRPDILKAILQPAGYVVTASFLNAQDASGNTALHLAAKWHKLQMLRDLLWLPRIDRTLCNEEGKTAQECAVWDSFHFGRHSPVARVDELFLKSAGPRHKSRFTQQAKTFPSPLTSSGTLRSISSSAKTGGCGPGGLSRIESGGTLNLSNQNLQGLEMSIMNDAHTSPGYKIQIQQVDEQVESSSSGSAGSADCMQPSFITATSGKPQSKPYESSGSDGTGSAGGSAGVGRLQTRSFLTSNSKEVVRPDGDQTPSFNTSEARPPSFFTSRSEVPIQQLSIGFEKKLEIERSLSLCVQGFAGNSLDSIPFTSDFTQDPGAASSDTLVLYESSKKTPSLYLPRIGVASYLLSAGLGALSRAFLQSVMSEINTFSRNLEADDPVRFTTIEDFEVLGTLGSGTFGVVYKVKRYDTGQLFALKVLHKAKFQAQNIIQKAYNENFILRTIKHPLMVSLHYAFQGPQYWALVMDFCPNGDAHSFLLRNGTPGLSQYFCAQLGGEVLLAIEHLHQNRIIYRDVKPDNVVLVKGDHARLTDFGLAKCIEEEGIHSVCGSNGYVAPEMLMASSNKVAYATSVDMYSYGVMLFVLLSGGEEHVQNDRKRRLPPRNPKAMLKNAGGLPGDFHRRSVTGGDVVHLMEELLKDDPSMRLTASAAKDHPWFQSMLGHPVIELLPDE